MRSRAITCTVDLDRIRSSAEAIKARTRVRMIAVIKADAYGLGAARVADALAPVADEFAYFWVSEAREVGRPGLLIGPPEAELSEFRELALRPTIGNLADAQRFAGWRTALSVDTGMQRFGCEPAEIAEILRLCDVDEIHTHAGGLQSIEQLRTLAGGLGRPLLAASTSLLHEPTAWLDGVRPGMALYRGALRVSTRLHSVRETRGPIGYTGFRAGHVGIILAGYSNRVQSAPVLINGRRQRILEVGMNSAFVTVDPSDHAGDEVVLLGDGLTEAEVAGALHVREHEVLCRYGSMGIRGYAGVSGQAGERPCIYAGVAAS